VTYVRVYGRSVRGGPVTPFPSDRPIRTVRLDLEAEAHADLSDVPHDLGDLRLTVHRSDWAVTAELDAYTYATDLDSDLDEG
jgi:hypothetical protein